MQLSEERDIEITLARELMALRGETLKSVEAATGIKAANISSWLRGKPQMISKQRIALLLNMLGVNGMRLRHDIVHEWRTGIGVNALEALFTLLGGHPAEERELFIGPRTDITLFSESHSLALLLTGTKKLIAIRIQLEPGLTPDPSLEHLPAGIVHELSIPPTELIITTPADFKKQLKQHVHATTKTQWYQDPENFQIAKMTPYDTVKVVSKMLTTQQQNELGAALSKLVTGGIKPEVICEHLRKLGTAQQQGNNE
ncbi:Cro/C1-type helix-turn-helix DNA-binding protein [Paraperlucidibaca baekdonensis]|uniref:Cro/C1-type helix-turn-helix DNA-binding protein n=1 Tax=Paraperlucidibaca baekdonensis TaxID=748120 RepID=A0A3E0H0P9_9GAMM|nr:helix-turn-helix transcriptional regulator [Paraperlucidibaca baekdonensis]REH35610.1 Cro/C1-type helix-turn-helix DNA-binding protein [Paraperlucidibaca baekdonensis]